MSTRTLLGPLSAAVVVAVCLAGPLGAQNPTLTRPPLANGIHMETPPISHAGYTVTINWGDGTNQTISAVTAVSEVHTTAPAAPPPRPSAAAQRAPSLQLDITFSADPNGSLTAWHAATVEGRSRRADLVVTKFASTGQVQQRCVYRSAIMSSWNVSSTDNHMSFRVLFAYQSEQCSAS